jgi:flagellar basal-body rod protein FlgF/flagellar basal-body rod protein FlgG
MEVLAHNMANVDTPGFKRTLAVLQARHTEAIEQGSDYPGSRTINDIGGGVQVAETTTEFSRGAVKRTGISTDMLIDGDGFFVVADEQRSYLTRAGNFLMTHDGYLVNSNGLQVLAEGGGPVRVDTSLPWRLDETGSVVQPGGSRIPVAVVKPQSLGDLVSRGRNLFEPLADTIPVPPEERRVLSGYLEHANIRPATEMMELIEASRAFEANVRLIQNQDQMMDTLISRVLRVQ